MANVSMTFTQTVFTSTYSPTAYSFNYPALTTRFTPPPECSGRWLAPGRRPNEVYSTAGPRGTDTRFDPKYSSCQPLSGQAVYSPGVCPDQYTIQTISELQFTSSGTFTSWWLAPCCPSGMNFRLDLGVCSQGFTTPLTAFAPITVVSGSSTKEVYIDVRANSSSSGGVYSFTNFTTFASGTAYADAVSVAWQAKDLAIFPPAYASSLAQRIGVQFTPSASPGSSSVLPSQTSSPIPANSSSSLSSGAKAGIAVGVVLAVLLAIIPAILLLRRRRRRNAASNPSNAAAELEGQEEKRKWYVGGKWRSEAQVEPRPGELDAKGDNLVPRELKGDNVMRGELDSREVHVVPGPPVELDGAEKR